MRSHFPADAPLTIFTDDELTAIFGAGAPRTCTAGEVILTEGEPGDSMFFVLEGQAEANLASGKKVRAYGPGTYFGELSFINPGHRRSITIVATTAVRLQVLNQQGVPALLATHPNAIFTLLRTAVRFMVDAERTLISDLRRHNAELQETIKRIEFMRRQLSQEEEVARTDGLTGLCNRRGFDEALPVFIERAAAIGTGLALLAMDLDHFKPVNDTLGHAAGDAVLRGVGKVLQQQVRKTDLSCRIGGDEFIILLVDLNEAAARKRAEAVRGAIEAMPQPGSERDLRITSTLGGTLYRPGETKEQFMQRADEALYAAKRAGRNRVDWIA